MKINREHLGAALVYGPFIATMLAPHGWAPWPVVLLLSLALVVCMSVGLLLMGDRHWRNDK